MNEEFNKLVEEAGFDASEALRAAIASALHKIEDRSFSGRHPELGKMVNCPFCDRRHRQNEFNCGQVFTYRVGDYELLKEDDNGELVPDYRTAVPEGARPTRNQVLGQPIRRNFSQPRFHPHISHSNLLLVERTRKLFLALGFSLDDKENFEKNLKVAKKKATRQLREEARAWAAFIRTRQHESRRINRGLL